MLKNKKKLIGSTGLCLVLMGVSLNVSASDDYDAGVTDFAAYQRKIGTQHEVQLPGDTVFLMKNNPVSSDPEAAIKDHEATKRRAELVQAEISRHEAETLRFTEEREARLTSLADAKLSDQELQKALATALTAYDKLDQSAGSLRTSLLALEKEKEQISANLRQQMRLLESWKRKSLASHEKIAGLEESLKGLKSASADYEAQKNKLTEALEKEKSDAALAQKKLEETAALIQAQQAAEAKNEESLKQKKKELEEAAEKLRRLQAEKAQLEVDARASTRTISSLEAELKDMSGKMHKDQTMIAALQDQLSGCKTRLLSIDAVIKNAFPDFFAEDNNSDINGLQLQLMIDGMVEQQNAVVTGLKNEKDEIARDLRRATLVTEELSQKNQRLQDMLGVAESEKEKLSEDAAQKAQRILILEGELKDLRLNLAALKDKIKIAEDENNKLSKSLSNTASLLKDKEEELRVEKEAHAKTLQKLQEETDSLKEIEADLASVKNQKVKLEAAIKNAEAAKVALEALHKREMTESVQSKEDAIATLKSLQTEEKARIEEEARDKELSYAQHVAELEAQHKALEAELSQVKERSEVRVRSLSQEVTTISAALDVSRRELEVTQGTAKDLRQRIAELDSALGASREDYSALQQKYVDAETDMLTAHRKIEQLEESLQNARTELDAAVEECRMLKASVNRLQSEKEALASEFEAETKALDVARAEISRIADLIIKKDEEIAAAKKQLEESAALQKTRLSELNNKIATLESDLEKNKSALQKADTIGAEKDATILRLQADRSRLVEELQSASSERDDLSKTLKGQETSLAASVKEKEALLRQKEGLDTDRAEKEERIQSLKSTLSTKEEALTAANTRINTLETEVASLKAKISEKEQTVESLRVEQQGLEERYKALQAEREADYEKLASSSEEVAAIREALGDATQSLSLQTSDIDRLTAELAQKTQEKASLQISLDALQGKYDALSLKIEADRATYAEKLKREANSKTELLQLIDDLVPDDLVGHKDSKPNEMIGAESVLNRLSSYIKYLNQSIEEVTDQSVTLEDERNALQAKLTELQKTLGAKEEKEKELQQVISDTEQELERHQAELSQKEKELTGLNAELTASNDNEARLVSENIGLLDKVDALQKKIAEQQELHFNLEEQIRVLEARQSENILEQSAISSQLSYMTNAQTKSAEEAEKARKYAEESEAYLDELTKRLKTAESSLKTSQDQESRLSADLVSVTEEKERLENTLQQAAEMGQQAVTSLAAEKEEHQKLSARLEVLQESEESLKATLQHAKETEAALKKEVAAQGNRIKEAYASLEVHKLAREKAETELKALRTRYNELKTEYQLDSQRHEGLSQAYQAAREALEAAEIVQENLRKIGESQTSKIYRLQKELEAAETRRERAEADAIILRALYGKDLTGNSETHDQFVNWSHTSSLMTPDRLKGPSRDSGAGYSFMNLQTPGVTSTPHVAGQAGVKTHATPRSKSLIDHMNKEFGTITATNMKQAAAAMLKFFAESGAVSTALTDEDFARFAELTPKKPMTPSKGGRTPLRERTNHRVPPSPFKKATTSIFG